MRTLHHPSREEIQLVDVLAALGHPIRLRVARALAGGEDRICGELVPEVSRSTMTSHWRALRESGVTRERAEGRKVRLSLRREDLDARFPGLLDSVLAAETAESEGAPAP